MPSSFGSTLPPPTSPAGLPAAPGGPRRLGPFELKALLGKSANSMLWWVVDTRVSPPPGETELPPGGAERLLLMPRVVPAQLQAWHDGALRALRVQHPALAPALEVGSVAPWPYMVFERSLGLTVEEWLVRHRVPSPTLAAQWIQGAAEGLAAAHDAHWSLGELQPFHLLLKADGSAVLLGLGLLAPAPLVQPSDRPSLQRAIEAETLSLGLLLHRLLGGRAPLECADTQEVLKRLPPLGNEFVRLGFEQKLPVDDAMRAIVNRATATQPSQRYLSARPFARVLQGWRQLTLDAGGGAVGHVLERIQRHGLLPVTHPDVVRQVQGGGLEQQHVHAMTGLVQKDPALSLELLRRVNLVRRQGGGTDAVLSIDRAIKMAGLGGVVDAARSLRPWPGVLSPERGESFKALLTRVERASQVAIDLAPAGFESETVRLAVLLQNLGRLMLAYHLPEEADQVQRLMQAPPATEEHPHPVGMGERQAAFGVLGCSLETLTLATINHLGLGEEAQHLALRPDAEQAIHPAHSDAESLRLTAAVSLELVDAVLQDEPRRKSALEHVVKRYARPLSLTARDIQFALFPEKAVGAA